MAKVQLFAKRCFSRKIQLPSCEFSPPPYKGPNLESLKNKREKFLNPSLTTYYSHPLALYQGYKQWLFDIDGNRYLDMFGGICTVSVGHSHPKIAEAVSNQMRILGHTSNLYLNPKIHEYSERLANKLPEKLKVIYFVNSGSEANDLAVLMARSYTKNFDIISLRNGYHGMSGQTMGLTATSVYKYPVPQQAGCHHAMNPDVYRGLWGGKHCRDSPVQTTRDCFCSSVECNATEKYLEQLLEVFHYSLPRRKVAAFFAESIQGVGGTTQYPKGYLKGAHKIVKENGGLFISDEVQTGFGRTGEHFWGFEMHGIVPDIVTMAKGIGNGFPLGAVITTSEVSQSLTKASHFNTFGGNPLAATAGIAVLDIIEEEALQENCRVLGNYFLSGLEQLQEEFSVIGDVRGKGLMIGVEMVTSKNSTSPMKSEDVLRIWEKCRDRGLLIGKGGYWGNVFRIKPPMCVTKEDVDFTINILREVLQEECSSK